MNAEFVRFAGQMSQDGGQVALVVYRGQEMQVILRLGYKSSYQTTIDGLTVDIVMPKKGKRAKSQSNPRINFSGNVEKI
jgi:hypothetical protein